MMPWEIHETNLLMVTSNSFVLAHEFLSSSVIAVSCNLHLHVELWSVHCALVGKTICKKGTEAFCFVCHPIFVRVAHCHCVPKLASSSFLSRPQSLPCKHHQRLNKTDFHPRHVLARSFFDARFPWPFYSHCSVRYAHSFVNRSVAFDIYTDCISKRLRLLVARYLSVNELNKYSSNNHKIGSFQGSGCLSQQ